MLIQRQYCFEGSDAAYIKHLEARVSDLEKRHSETPQQFRLERCETCSRSFTDTGVAPEIRSGIDQFPIHPGEAPKTHEKGSISRLSDVGMRGQESVGRHGAERRIEQQQSTPSNSEPLNSTSSEGTSFNIVVWDPLGDPKPRSRKTNGEYDQTQAKLFKDFVGLTSNLPTTSDWKIGNSERATYHWGNISAFKLNLPTGLKQPSVLPLTHSPEPAPISSPLISPSVPICTSATIGYPRTSIETLLAGYINVPEVSEKKNANFRKLVLCSACLVAMETTHVDSKDDVYRVLRRILESDANIGRLQSLCRGARWITQATSLLSTTEWKLRSWDIPYLAGKSLDFYARLSDCSVRPESFIEDAKQYITKSPNILSCLEGCPNSSLAAPIPLIVETVLQKTVPLKNIFEHLRCDLPHLEMLRSGISERLPSGKKRGRHQPNYMPKRKRHCTDNPKHKHGNHVPRQAFSMNVERDELVSLSDSTAMEDVSFSTYQNPELSQPIEASGTNDGWFGTYQNPEHSQPAEASGTNDGWFSTYQNPEFSQPIEASGTNDGWFSTYQNPEFSQPIEASGTNDGWFSTYQNPELSQPAEASGTNDGWFSTYQNPEFSQPIEASGTNDGWFSTYQNAELGELAQVGD